jgi:hypothetical protein
MTADRRISRDPRGRDDGRRSFTDWRCVLAGQHASCPARSSMHSASSRLHIRGFARAQTAYGVQQPSQLTMVSVGSLAAGVWGVSNR